MKIPFRQGIFKQNTGKFLALSKAGISIISKDFPLFVTFSSGTKEYLQIENTDQLRWKIPSNASTCWLYWELNEYTGIVQYRYTLVNPFASKGYGVTYPKSPVVDQHFFDLSEMKMKQWDGNKWNNVLRVFAGVVKSSNLLTEIALGSQVGANITTKSGSILFDSKAVPIKHIGTFGKGDFVTSETLLTDNNLDYFSIESEKINILVSEPIPKYHCVGINNRSQYCLAKNTDSIKTVGISVYDITKNTKGPIIQYGEIKSMDWNWGVSSGTPLYSGTTGELTTSIPKKISKQKVGYVIDNYTIFVDIGTFYSLEEINPTT